MKLLVIHNKYQSNHIGGEDIVYRNELKSLQNKLGKQNVLSYDVSNDDINRVKIIFGIWFSFKHYHAVKKIIIENKIDLVHIHNFYPLLTPSIFKASKDAGAKVVHTLHNYRLWCISGIFFRDNYGICELCTRNRFSFSGILNKCYRKSFLQSTLAQLSFWFYDVTRAFDNIDYFFVLTQFQKEKIKALGISDKKIVLKPNGLDMTANLNKKKGDHYIYVGRLEKSKGVFDLLNTWLELDDKYKLTVIGSGYNDDEIKNKYKKNNIHFREKCSREKTLEAISSSKYLIQSSILYESSGLTIIEAMSFGVPVIGFDIGTRKDFITDGVNGFLTNQAGLKKTIEKSFSYHEYDVLSNNAYQKSKKFENEAIIEKQINIYKDILENG